MRRDHEGRAFKIFGLLVFVVGVGITMVGAFPFFSKSDNPNLRISDFPAGQAQAGILSAGQRGLAVSPGGAVVAVWSDTREGGSDIYLTRSLDGGRTFGLNRPVNDTAGTAGLFGAVVALSQHDQAYVAWFDERDGDADIFFARETDEGPGFTANVRVNDDKMSGAASHEFMPDDFFDKSLGAKEDVFQTLPSLVVDRQGMIHVAWQDYRRNQADIYFATSVDGGKTFTSNLRINDDFGRAGQLYPSIGADASGVIYVAWHDFREGDPDIYFSRSTDGGKTFAGNIRINDDEETEGQFNPSLAVDEQGEVHVAWHDLRNGNADIYYASSRDRGVTFSANIRVNDDAGEAYQFHPSLAVNGRGDVGIVWEDYRDGHANIYFAKKTTGQSSFAKNVRVNDDDDPVDHLHASLIGTPNAAFAAMWTDKRNDAQYRSGACRPLHCSDVYFAREIQ